MALILPGASSCAVCRGGIATANDLVATTHFLPAEHPLWRFSDAVMHRACFLAWPDRAAFVEAYNTIFGSRMAGNGTRHHMHDDGRIEVVVVDPVRHARAAEEAAAEAAAAADRSATQQRRDAEWRGRMRSCPRCAHAFASVQDKGACPSCQHVFHASDPDGK